jgi:hypothetical protein
VWRHLRIDGDCCSRCLTGLPRSLPRFAHPRRLAFEPLNEFTQQQTTNSAEKDGKPSLREELIAKLFELRIWHTRPAASFVPAKLPTID